MESTRYSISFKPVRGFVPGMSMTFSVGSSCPENGCPKTQPPHPNATARRSLDCGALEFRRAPPICEGYSERHPGTRQPRPCVGTRLSSLSPTLLEQPDIMRQRTRLLNDERTVVEHLMGRETVSERAWFKSLDFCVHGVVLRRNGTDNTASWRN